MDELRESILYGSLAVDVDMMLYTFTQQLEILRYIVAKPASLLRIRIQNRPDDRLVFLFRTAGLRV